MPIPPGYIRNLENRLRKATKGILPPTLEMIIKTYYPLTVRQAPVHPQQQKIPSCSLSPMPCTKPESSRHVFWSTGRWKERGAVGNLTRSAARCHDGKTLGRGSQPAGATTSFGGREQGSYGRTFPRRSGKTIFSSTRREGPRNTTSHRSPFRETSDRPATARGDNKKHREGGETTPFKQTSGGTRKLQQQHKSLLARRLQAVAISEGRRPSKTSTLMVVDVG